MWQGWVQATRCSALRQSGRGEMQQQHHSLRAALHRQTTAPITHQRWPYHLFHRHVGIIPPWSPSLSRSRRRAAASRGAVPPGHWRPAAAATALPPRLPPPRRWAAMEWWRSPCCRWPRPPHAAGQEAAERPEGWSLELRAVAPPDTPPGGPPRRQARCRPTAHPHLIVAAVDEQEGVVHGRGQGHVQRQLPGLALGPARPP